MINKGYLDELTFEIIGAAIEVHKAMGRGLLENVYFQCMKEELRRRKINFITEMLIPVVYKEKELDASFRCDFFIENAIVLELKSVKDFNPVYEAQLMTYMRLLKAPKGILINFNSANIFYEGQKTFVNEFFTHLE